MRFYLTNIEVARGVANRLRGALKDRGYPRTHTKRLAAASAMFGYTSWSDLTAHCPTTETASPFDGGLDDEELLKRAEYQAQALARTAHIPLAVAADVVAEVRPTSSATGSELRLTDDIDDIVVEISVPGTPDPAFEHFVYGIGDWWPNAFTFSMAALDEIVLEPKSGGRWYEKSLSGDERDWGIVTACEYACRIVMTFQISAARTVTPRDKASEVSFDFFIRDGGCIVRMTHFHIYKHGPDAEAIRANMSSQQGWQFILDNYARSYKAMYDEKIEGNEK